MSVGIVPVQVPVAGFVVYLYVSNPQRATYFYLRVEEVGSVVMVVQSRVYHLYELSVGGRKLLGWK